MLDTTAESRSDLRPAILICAYEPDEPWGLSQAGDAWAPAGARMVPVPADDPVALAEVLSRCLADKTCRGLLLVGRTRRSDAFRVQTRAENRAMGARERLFSTGPGVARATAPAADIVRALTDAGLNAGASSESEADAGDYLLYRVLAALPADADAPSVGLLRVPAHSDAASVSEGVRAATTAIARTLSPLPRARQH